MTQEQTVNTTARAVLRFKTDTGRVGSFSVPRANLSKSQGAAVMSMRNIIASGAVDFGGSAPVSELGASLVKTVRTVIV